MAEQTSRRHFSSQTTALQVLEGIDLTGKIFIVTGANTGIGFETAKALAIHDACVILACRNLAKAEEAKNEIIKVKPNATVEVMRLDCNELQSCEDFSKTFLAQHRWLHGLILNAGVVNPPEQLTKDGFEATFQINHLSQFYLVRLLTPALTAAAPSRVITVSSMAHKFCFFVRPRDISWQNFSPAYRGCRNFGHFGAYARSKLCNILFANELNSRLQDKGVTANAVHPGFVRSNISRSYSLLNAFFCCVRYRVVNCEQGAATVVYCATAPELEKTGGKYYVHCKEVMPYACARNEASAQRLWNLSEEMIQYYLWRTKPNLATQAAIGASNSTPQITVTDSSV